MTGSGPERMTSHSISPAVAAESDAQRLASASNVAVVLPAGAGKTELIARATGFASEATGRQLILTHTHAGVHALRARLARLGAEPRSYTLTTIAGWALKWAAHYPSISGLTTAEPASQDEWNAVYEGARRVLANPHLAASIRASYGGIFVDEYQDCTQHQHRIALALADLLPLRLLGDPLQGIFGFTGESIRWSKDVESTFAPLEVEEHFWRWADSNPELGEWLLELRQLLLECKPIDLAAAPIDWIPAVTPATQVQTSKQVAADETASVVAILKWPNQCHSLAKRLGGLFSSMDELESKDLLRSARTLDLAASGHQAAVALIDIARECFTRLPPALNAARKTLEAGNLPRISARTRHVPLVSALVAVADSPTPLSLLAAAEAIETLPEIFAHRSDLWRAVVRSMTVWRDDDLDTIREAAVVVRDRTRESGRAVQLRTVSRTILVKGLEYDHAVILDAGLLDAQDFYVAATRGRRTLTVLSDRRILQFPVMNL